MSTRRTLPILLCGIWVAACGSSSPARPTLVTTIATSVASTTTSVPAVTSVRYIGTFTQPGGAPSLPLDLTLTFGLPRGGLGSGLVALAAIYDVTGGYNTGPSGFTGSITGTLDGTLDSGTFTGVMTANLANGCVARRNYSGPLTRQALNWTPGTQLETCGGASPLSAPVNPPASTQPPTTSIAATTTTVPVTTTTTTSVPVLTTTTSVSSTTTSVTAASCGFSPPSTFTYPVGGGSSSSAVSNIQPPASCVPVLEGVCSWITASPLTQGSNGIFLNYVVQVNPTGSPARSCVLTIRNSLNTGEFTTRTVNQSGSTTTTSTTSISTTSTTSVTTSSTTSTTSSVSTTTTSAFQFFPLTLVLTGAGAYTVSSPQSGVFTCVHGAGAGTVQCGPNSAFGTIQLDSTVVMQTVGGCDSFINNRCTVFMSSSKTITFTPLAVLK